MPLTREILEGRPDSVLDTPEVNARAMLEAAAPILSAREGEDRLAAWLRRGLERTEGDIRDALAERAGKLKRPRPAGVAEANARTFAIFDAEIVLRTLVRRRLDRNDLLHKENADDFARLLAGRSRFDVATLPMLNLQNQLGDVWRSYNGEVRIRLLEAADPEVWPPRLLFARTAAILGLLLDAARFRRQLRKIEAERDRLAAELN